MGWWVAPLSVPERVDCVCGGLRRPPVSPLREPQSGTDTIIHNFDICAALGLPICPRQRGVLVGWRRPGASPAKAALG